MTKKQKQVVARIVVTFVLLVAIMISEHTGWSECIQPHVLLAFICLIPYLIIGYDILYKAARNIRNGQVFDENFLMMIATSITNATTIRTTICFCFFVIMLLPAR